MSHILKLINLTASQEFDILHEFKYEIIKIRPFCHIFGGEKG